MFSTMRRWFCLPGESFPGRIWNFGGCGWQRLPFRIVLIKSSVSNGLPSAEARVPCTHVGIVHRWRKGPAPYDLSWWERKNRGSLCMDFSRHHLLGLSPFLITITVMRMSALSLWALLWIIICGGGGSPPLKQMSGMSVRLERTLLEVL